MTLLLEVYRFVCMTPPAMVWMVGASEVLLGSLARGEFAGVMSRRSVCGEEMLMEDTPGSCA